jgi:hypothetical protein
VVSMASRSAVVDFLDRNQDTGLAKNSYLKSFNVIQGNYICTCAYLNRNIVYDKVINNYRLILYEVT